MSAEIQRRSFLGAALLGAAAASVPSPMIAASAKFEFEISLNERSLARTLAANTIDHLDLARIAKTDLDISAVEYTSKFFRDKVHDEKYLDEMNLRAADHSVRQLLVMLDDEGRIASADVDKQKLAMRQHRLWIDAAKALGCHSIQLDPTSSGTADEQLQRAVAAIGQLCEYATTQNVNVLLGNYGGVSASAAWIVAAVKAVNLPCCGTLPRIGKLATDQDYANLAPIVPFAKGVTAATYEFDQRGQEKFTDYRRAMNAVQQAGYRGYVGIHYAGTQADEIAGIRATKTLLESVRGTMVQDGNH